MRDSNPIQQTPIEKLPVYSRHVLLFIYKLLTAIDREKENISFADKKSLRMCCITVHSAGLQS